MSPEPLKIGSQLPVPSADLKCPKFIHSPNVANPNPESGIHLAYSFGCPVKWRPKHMQWWTAQQLKSKSALTRLQAVDKLAAEGSADSVACLIAAMEDPDPEIRKAAVRALGRLRVADALPVLVQALRDSEAAVREAAVASLREIGDLQAVDAMVAALEDPNAGVRWHAAKTLERFGWQPRNDRERMLRDVGLGNFGAAARVGLEALKPLITALNDPAYPNRRAVVEALAQIEDEQVVMPLISVLKDPDSSVRVAAVEGLSLLRDKRAVQHLALLLRDPEPSVRAAVVATLGVIADPGSITSLMKAV